MLTMPSIIAAYGRSRVETYLKNRLGVNIIPKKVLDILLPYADTISEWLLAYDPEQCSWQEYYQQSHPGYPPIIDNIIAIKFSND